MRTFRIGSRGSQLALWQSNFIRDQLSRRCGAACEIVIIKTSGDRFQQAPVGQLGLKGVFIKELEDALLEGQVDFAVHSMKDVPTEIPRGLVLAAAYERVDVRDCMISRGNTAFRELPSGARIGTSSLRRQSQLAHLRSDVQILELRGNVDTRLAKLDRGDYDAILLAKAGLDRLGLSHRISQVFSTEELLPAVGQGALALECREDDAEVRDALGALDHPETRAGVTAERALLAKLEGGCQVPLGALGRVEAGVLRLDACVIGPGGKQYIRGQVSGHPRDATQLGESLAAKLLADGADSILHSIRKAPHAGG